MAQTITIAEGVSGAIVPDSWLSSLNPTTNYGASITMDIGYVPLGTSKRRAILGFDLSVIPRGASVIDASLYINVSVAAGSAVAAKVRRITGDGIDWKESEVTWNMATSTLRWSTPGGDYTTTDQVSWTLPTGTGAFEIKNMDTLVRDAIAERGNALNILLMRDPEDTSSFLRMSSGEVIVPENRPYLSVDYNLSLMRRRIERY